MGRKDKKKGGGMEKTLAKTEKNLAKKLKRQTGKKTECDLEQVVQRLAAEAAARQLSETICDPPSPRSALSLCVHPEREELIFFGGELYDGRHTTVYGDLLVYRVRSQQWRQLQLPGAPPPRSGHAAVAVARGGGQMWLFGGEYTDPSGERFHHYRDLWCLSINDRRWEKIKVSGGPSARSGHRMVQWRHLLLVFGGFHDSGGGGGGGGGGSCRYMNDVHAFDMERRHWLVLSVSGQSPSARSSVLMLTLADGRVLIYGGYSRQPSASAAGGEMAVTHTDMFHLVPEGEGAELRWMWRAVRQTGVRPPLRAGMAGCCVGVASGAPGGQQQQQQRVLLFGGVSDQQSEDALEGTFYCDMFWLDPSRGHWRLVQLSGSRPAAGQRPRRRRRRRPSQDDDDRLEQQQQPAPAAAEPADQFEYRLDDNLAEALSVTEVEGGQRPAPPFVPCARSHASMVARGSRVYLFGGKLERGSAELTLADMYTLDTAKMDEWKTLLENSVESVWNGSDDDNMDDDSDDEDDDSDSDEDDESMDDGC